MSGCNPSICGPGCKNFFVENGTRQCLKTAYDEAKCEDRGMTEAERVIVEGRIDGLNKAIVMKKIEDVRNLATNVKQIRELTERIRLEDSIERLDHISQMLNEIKPVHKARPQHQTTFFEDLMLATGHRRVR